MNILISTGIYPPKIGGPAEYSKNLKKSFELAQNMVRVSTFGVEGLMPTGVRHLWFLFKTVPKVIWADLIIVMDTFSVGLPTVFLAKILGKKSIIRTGGDFLWESYVERTGKKVLLKDFYQNEKSNFSLKDRIIFKLTKWTLKNASGVVFSTEWQKNIFLESYDLQLDRVYVIENYYGNKEKLREAPNFIFVGSTRKLVWKNLDTLKNVFNRIGGSANLFLDNLKYEDLLEKMRNSYAVILVSLGDISPNMILDSIRLGKPFVCTKEVGILNRIKDVGIYVDPLNEKDIADAIVYLMNPENYNIEIEKIKNFNFTHDWDQITSEFLNIYKKI